MKIVSNPSGIETGDGVGIGPVFPLPGLQFRYEGGDRLCSHMVGLRKS